MAIIFAGPFDTGNMLQAQWEEVESKLWSSGVINGARNSFAVTTTSGLGVSVNTGDAVVDSFRFYSDTATALTATAADPTNPRIDRVILRVDGTGHTATIVIKAGTPAPSPTPPALTQTTPAGTFEISLAQIRINAGATTIATLTDERTYTTAAIGPNAITSAQILSVLASAVQAGTLPAGVLLPAGQVSAGNLSTGSGTLQAEGGTIGSNGAGRWQAPTLWPSNFGSGTISGIGPFSGTGSGTFTHGLSSTPVRVDALTHVNGSQTMGYDSETASNVHITCGGGLAFSARGWA